MVENEERSLTAFLWLYVNDIYSAASVLMPILNDPSHWVKPGSQDRLTALQEGLSMDKKQR